MAKAIEIPKLYSFNFGHFFATRSNRTIDSAAPMVATTIGICFVFKPIIT